MQNYSFDLNYKPKAFDKAEFAHNIRLSKIKSTTIKSKGAEDTKLFIIIHRYKLTNNVKDLFI